MAIIFNKYIDNKDHTWYDSTNVIYSLCYDSSTEKKNVKIVFKNGRTYLYKDVDVNDYVAFRCSESHGKGVNQYIVKKYSGIRLPDTDIDKLNKLKDEFIDNNELTEKAFSNLAYHLSVNDITGEFVLMLNDKPIYRGVEGQVSIINLLKCMNIGYTLTDDYIAVEENTENNDLQKDDKNDE